MKRASKHMGGVQHMGASKHTRGIQTYREVSKHGGIQDSGYTYGVSKNAGGIQTYGLCPNIWGIQTYRKVSKHMGAFKHTGGHPNMWASKHTGDIQTLQQAEKHYQLCYTYGGNQTYRGHPNIQQGIQIYGCIWGHPNLWVVSKNWGHANI